MIRPAAAGGRKSSCCYSSLIFQRGRNNNSKVPSSSCRNYGCIAASFSGDSVFGVTVNSKPAAARQQGLLLHMHRDNRSVRFFSATFSTSMESDDEPSDSKLTLRGQEAVHDDGDGGDPGEQRETRIYKPWLDPNLSLDERAQQLLNSPRLHPLAHHDLTPLLRQLCKKGTLQGMQVATDIVERLIIEKNRLHEQSGSAKLVCIPVRKWEILMYGWAVMAKSSQHSAVALVRMQELLQRVTEEATWDEERYEPPRDTAQSRLVSLPTVDVFNTYLFGLAQAAKVSPASPDKNNTIAAALPNLAVEVLEEMTDKCFRWHCRPNTKSYMHAIVACSNSRNNAQAGQLALDILRKMQVAHQQEKVRYEDQYNCPYDSMNITNNRRKVVTPDIRIYTATMKALLKSNSTINAVMATDLLRELLEVGENSVDDDFYYLYQQVDVTIFVMAISAFSQLIQRERNDQSKRLEYAQQAEKVLCMAIEFVANIKNQQYDDNSSTSIAHDEDDRASSTKAATFSHSSLLLRPAFNSCLDAWSRALAPEAPLQCERILETMITGGVTTDTDDHYGGNDDGDGDLLGLLFNDTDATRKNNVIVVPKPDTISFNSCLYAWSRATKFHDDAAQKAIKLLIRQQELCDSSRSGGDLSDNNDTVSDCMPDFQSYSVAILALAHASNSNGDIHKIQEARQLLETMISNLQQGRVKQSRNPTAPFSAFLTAVARCPSLSVSSAMTEEMMVGEDISDNDDYFNSVVETDNDMYSLALRTYREVIDDAHKINTKPDHHFFAAMLRCIAQHCDEKSNERINMSMNVFDTACQEGCVSRIVAQALMAVLGDRKDVILRDIDFNRMMQQWYCNVPTPERFYPRTKKRRKKAATKGA